MEQYSSSLESVLLISSICLSSFVALRVSELVASSEVPFWWVIGR